LLSWILAFQGTVMTGTIIVFSNFDTNAGLL
jgi:hypothetical protein